MNNWPVYYRERIWLGNVDTGYVGIATLWTPKEDLVRSISSELKNKISAVGQLYTKRGSEYIFRNIWANPKVRYLILWGENRTDSYQPLVKKLFLKEYLPDEIEKKYLDTFFDQVQILDWRQKTKEEIFSGVASLERKPAFSENPKVFPETKPKGDQFPAEESSFRIEGKTIGEAWLQILQMILRFGHRIPRIYVYGGHEKMLLNLMAVITEENIKDPKIWPFFNFDKDHLRTYFKNFFTPNRGKEAYTYGERLFSYKSDGKTVDQVSQMTKKMQRFPYDKGAIATLWQPQIDNFPIRDPWRTPCLSLVQGFCLDDKFYLTAYFRSNDMFAAWPQNAFALRKLQTEIADRIGKKVGNLTTVSHSAFIDDSDLIRTEKVVEENKRMFCRPDPRGNLLVEVDSSEIVVKHLSPETKVLAEYRVDGSQPKAALQMARILLEKRVISRIGHALDIGEQLGRAEDAIKLGLKFEQDKMLK